jgi:enolase-phosphatase E1
VHGPHIHTAPDRVELSDVRAVLLDVEGTTTPVEFVHNILFPYARARVQEFLARHAADPDVHADLVRLRAEHAAEPPGPPAPPPWRDDSASVVAYVHWIMDRDRKSTGLKSLQGKIWEAGYRAGELRGQVYADVLPAFIRWKEQGRDIAVFSSGSVQAQQCLFANSTAGDLSSFIRAYFDTTTGPKTAAESYERIAAAVERSPSQVLFLSDVGAELDAARRAGLQTALCVRSQETVPPVSGHPVIRTFDQVPLDNAW